MKKLFAFALLTLAGSAFAQQRCTVELRQYNNRVIERYTVYGQPGSCIEGMKQCRKDIRLQYSRNPSWPNTSLDCIDLGDYNPNPNPYPQNPNPNPYPQNPQPNPYRSVEVTGLILDVASTIYDSQSKTKVVESLITNTRSYNLGNLNYICSQTRTWPENASCLVDGVNRAPRETIDESSAIYAVAQACTQTKTWPEEQSCFSASLRNTRLPSLNYLAQSCAGMYNTESSARCYRSVFGL